MEGITLVLLIALVVLIVLSKSWRSLFMTPGAMNIPGPAAWPIIGNANFFIGANNLEKALQAFTNLAKAYDAPLNRIWLGPKLVILVKTPKYIDALLTHKAAGTKDDFLYRTINTATGNGVFTRNGEAWQRMRKPMASLLLPKNINRFQEIICQKVTSLCQELEVKTCNESFDISLYIKIFSLELVCEAAMGTKNTAFLGENKFETLRRMEGEIEDAFENMFSLKGILGLKNFNPEAFHKHFGGRLCGLINERKKQLKSLGINYMTDEPKNYIDIVVRTAEIERTNEFETGLLQADFIIAGTDTMSVAIIVLLTLLAMHQDYQEKVYQELVDIFGHSDRNPQESDLRHMVFLDMCMKEALRHCSPPAVARAADEDIEIDGYKIPKGTALLFTLCLTLEDPQYWERPNEFFPEHFLSEAVAKRPKGAFLPFVVGPRMCPGQQYSYQAIKTVVSTLLRRFHLTTDQKYSELKYKYLLMREPVNPLIKISKRLP